MSASVVGKALVWIDGAPVDAAEARVSVFDRGFLYGDSVYEVLWWHRGAAIQADDHFARLRESAKRIYMNLDSDVDVAPAIDLPHAANTRLSPECQRALPPGLRHPGPADRGAPRGGR